MPLPALVAAAVPGVLDLLDRIIPDPVEREKAKAELLKQEGQQAITELQTRLSAILAEAQSSDPWTSRARPSFLYVMYTLFGLCMVGSIVGIWFPIEVSQAATNLGVLFEAIPGELYALFGAGYLGYGAFRTYEKQQGVAGKVRLPGRRP